MLGAIRRGGFGSRAAVTSSSLAPIGSEGEFARISSKTSSKLTSSPWPLCASSSWPSPWRARLGRTPSRELEEALLLAATLSFTHSMIIIRTSGNKKTTTMTTVKAKSSYVKKEKEKKKKKKKRKIVIMRKERRRRRTLCLFCLG